MANSTLILDVDFRPLTVSRCANFSGSASIHVTADFNNSDTQTLRLFNYACHNGNFSDITILGNDPCQSFNNATAIYGSNDLVLTFSISENENCNNNISQMVIIGCSVAAGLVGLVVLFLVLVFFVPPLRRRILPYKDRVKHRIIQHETPTE